jgi:hypothetical protein
MNRTFAGNLDRHTRENGYPAFSTAYWIPACAGTTESESPVKFGEFKRWLERQGAAMNPAKASNFRASDYPEFIHPPHTRHGRSPTRWQTL